LSFRFQADADLNLEIGRGLRRREPSIDFRAVAGVVAEGAPDPEVLQIAADDNRVLVSRDIATMPGHSAQFVAWHESRDTADTVVYRPIGSVIEGLFVVWLTWTPEDLRNQARRFP
jgi:Domain of unknown function (DUF5615)